MKKLFYKFFLSYFFITFFLSFFIFIFSYEIVKKTYIEGLKKFLRDFNFIFISYIPEFIEKRDYVKLKSFIQEKAQEIDIRVTVLDSGGNVLFDSKKEELFMENQKTKPEISEALKGKIGISIRYSEALKEKMLYLATPFIKDEKIMGVLRTSIFMKDINKLLFEFKKRILLIVLIVLIFSWIISIFISENFSSPLKELLKSFRKLLKGEFNVKILTKRKDEIGELTKEFNEMVSRVEELFKEVKKESGELFTFISSIPDGILLINKKGEIIFYNEKMKEILKEDIEKGKFYFEVIKVHGFTRMMEELRKREEAKGEIEINGKILFCNLRKIPDTEEILSVFYDITEIKRLDEIKKDLIINISHEIKTPLTAIKGFVETLEEEEDIKNRRYIEIIKNHIDRLMDIIEKTLFLSELEKGEAILELQSIDLKELIYDIIPIFEKRLREKGIDLKVELEENLPKFKVDRFKMEQVFINLIDNAIKYTEKGEIRISGGREGNNIKIEVEDTGIGIPEEHLSRIFERFYVVDKARDRKKGGAGLGLAIVKHIVLLHNGKIDVKSEKGKGTKFIITIPIFEGN